MFHVPQSCTAEKVSQVTRPFPHPSPLVKTPAVRICMYDVSSLSPCHPPYLNPCQPSHHSDIMGAKG